MKEEHNRKLLNSFEFYLHQNFENYCKRHSVINDHKNFITYLIDKKLISVTIMRRYTVTNEFETQYPKHNFHKSKTITTLASLFNLSSRYIWSLLKYDSHVNARKGK